MSLSTRNLMFIWDPRNKVQNKEGQLFMYAN